MAKKHFKRPTEWTRIDSSNTSNTSNMTIQYDPQTLRITTQGGTPTTGTDDCNESLKHSNAEKAIFHAVKGAKRMTDEDQHDEAAVIAGQAGRAFLAAEDIDYDPDHSEEYLWDQIIENLRSDKQNIAAGIDKAFDKIDYGNHKGGARIAVSLADEFVRGFER